MQTDPVIGTGFFGREEIVSIFHKRLEAFEKGYRQNIALVGPRSIGKTSLLLNFALSSRKKDIIPIYVEILPEPFEYFAQRFMGAMLYATLLLKRKEAPRHFNVLIKHSKRLIPKTVKQMRLVKRMLSKGELNEAFQEMLALTRLLHEETGKKIILALDGLDLFDHFFLRNPFSQFGKEIMVQKEVLYIVACARAERAKNIFREELALLFGNFEILEVRPYDFETSKRFIEERLRQHTVSEAHKKFLIQMTNGHPFYLDTLLARAHSILEERHQRELTENVLVDIFHEELFKRQGRLYQYFYLCIRGAHRFRFTQPYVDTLLAIASGHRKVSSIARFVERKPLETKKILARIHEEEVITKRGSFYVLGDPLFAFWLKQVYNLRRVSLDMDMMAVHEEFRSGLSEIIKRLEAEDHKDLPQRVEELLRQFKNDVIELNRRRFRCPDFQEILSKPSNGRMFPVQAKNQNYRWMCQVASKRISEDDVRLFLDEISRLRKKVQRKILIALRGIDLNAKLMAQGEHIAIWDLRSFNTLLDLYGKPKVIL